MKGAITMKNTIKLKNSILINNENVSEITVDTDGITSLLYAEADIRKRIAAGARNVAVIPAVEFDFGLHTYIGYAAAIAANPSYSFSDLERVHGSDLLAFAEVGRNFLLKSEDAQPNSSDEQSATTPERSTQASQTSKESE